MAVWIWSKLSSAKWRDAWEERLGAGDRTDLVITDFAGRSTVRIDVYCRSRRDAEAIRSEFGGSVRELKSRNWAALGTRRRPPLRIRSSLIVDGGRGAARLAALERQFPGRAVLVIPADMAFGTGDHATTATCLRLIADESSRRRGTDWSVADLGCGTGILALAAMKLGAARGDAFDYDPAAVRVAKANAATHGVRRLRISRLDVLNWDPPAGWQRDVVAANLFSDVLAQAFPLLRRIVAPGGTLIISGILNDHAAECLAAGRRAGFDFEPALRRGKWTTARACPAPAAARR